MKYATLTDHTFALRLELGDDIHASLQQFCADNAINNAQVSGIGSVDSPVLAHYSIKTRQYGEKALDGIYEITSLTGNISISDGAPFVHLHVTVSDEAMAVSGGHLVKGTCSATLELIVTAYPSSFTKTFDESVGLKVWDF
jgi:predicted DNA-binding protein with PD1-like motif